MHRPSHKDHLPWPRFWSPRKSRAHGTSGEFFEDPQGLFGKHLHPQAATLSEITPETGLLVLCGEPGLGKTTELDLLRASLPATFGENERLIYLKARTFESFTDLQGHLDSHPDWQAWLLDDDRLTILLDGLDEGLIGMPTEAVSDYVARCLRDRIGPSSKVVVNREVQPRRGQRTDILVEAWSHSPNGRNRQEAPLSVTIEVKGCWNDEIKTGAKNQLLDGYLRPFGRTHGIFLVAWFHSPGHAKLDPNQTTELKHQTMAHAEQAVAAYAQPAQISGFTIAPFVLDCRLP